ncbi:MAG: chorismate mutase [Ignavibacterium sp.]|nr:chorismate mutase [Ignavibacterium sp.]MCX7610858.1 chorismate mutase [Ignavibacterium sp.]MDW8375444.1 chorismate mutase [Ignavibacteriales bacterium]
MIQHSPELEKKLNDLRNKIDDIDFKIRELLLERFQLVERIIQIKKELSSELFDNKREIDIYNMIIKDLPSEVAASIKNIFEQIIIESRSFQKKRLGN